MYADLHFLVGITLRVESLDTAADRYITKTEKADYADAEAHV